MRLLVDQVKKVSAFCESGLENYYYYHFLFNKIQNRIIKKRPFISDRKYEERVKKYFAVRGFEINPMWHSFYAANNGIKDIKYIPENLYFGKIEPYYNRKAFARAIDDKNYYDLYLSRVGADSNIPFIYVRNISGYFYNHDFELIDENEAARICKAIKTEFVIKPSIDGKGGAGVRFVQTEKESKKSIKAIFRNLNKDFVVQEVVHQDGVLHEINPSSVNTVRFMTFHTGKEIVLLSAILRMGTKDTRVDNAYCGGIFCGIDDYGYTKDTAWNKEFIKLKKHPNGNEFKNIKIPNYFEMVELLKRQHMRMGHFRIVSWDVAFSQKSSVIIEYNLHLQGIDIHQVCNGSLFGSFTDQVLNDIKRK